MKEMFSALPQEDTRVEDIDRAHEMAHSGNYSRTEAALSRAASSLVGGMIKEGHDVHDVLPEIAFGKGGSEPEQAAAKKAVWMADTSVRSSGFRMQPEAIANNLAHFSKAMDIQADSNEELAAKRYDAKQDAQE